LAEASFIVLTPRTFAGCAGFPARSAVDTLPLFCTIRCAIVSGTDEIRMSANQTFGGCPMPARRRWIELSWPDLQGADTGRWIAVLPLAAVEQHGPHLPLGTDALIAEAYLAEVEAALPADLPAVLLPVMTIGVSPEHLGFPGTLSLAAGTALAGWTAIGEGLRRAGLRKLVIVTSHGGNVAAASLAAVELRRRFGLLAVTCSWHKLGYPDGLFSPDEVRFGIHGGDIETSLMLAIRPDLVRMDRARDFPSSARAMEAEFAHLRATSPVGFGWMAQDLNPDGVAGNASAATAEKGAAALRFGANAFVALLRDVERFDVAALTPGPLA
jgi:creatinine amidohydrolase